MLSSNKLDQAGINELLDKLGTKEYYNRSRSFTEEEAQTRVGYHISDPFKKDCIQSIWIQYSRKLFEQYHVWDAKITTKNGAVTGEIKSKEHLDLRSLLMELEDIMKSLKS